MDGRASWERNSVIQNRGDAGTYVLERALKLSYRASRMRTIPEKRRMRTSSSFPLENECSNYSCHEASLERGTLRNIVCSGWPDASTDTWTLLYVQMSIDINKSLGRERERERGNGATGLCSLRGRVLGFSEAGSEEDHSPNRSLGEPAAGSRQKPGPRARSISLISGGARFIFPSFPPVSENSPLPGISLRENNVFPGPKCLLVEKSFARTKNMKRAIMWLENVVEMNLKKIRPFAYSVTFINLVPFNHKNKSHINSVHRCWKWSINFRQRRTY